MKKGSPASMQTGMTFVQLNSAWTRNSISSIARIMITVFTSIHMEMVICADAPREKRSTINIKDNKNIGVLILDISHPLSY